MQLSEEMRKYIEILRERYLPVYKKLEALREERDRLYELLIDMPDILEPLALEALAQEGLSYRAMTCGIDRHDPDGCFVSLYRDSEDMLGHGILWITSSKDLEDLEGYLEWGVEYARDIIEGREP